MKARSSSALGIALAAARAPSIVGGPCAKSALETASNAFKTVFRA